MLSLDYKTMSGDVYTSSGLYTFVHNTILPNLRKSGLNITSCDLVSRIVFNDIVSKTGKTSKEIIGNDNFWFTDNYDLGIFYYIGAGGSISYYNSYINCGVRPLITVVK